MNQFSSFSSHLQELRHRKGISAKALAASAGVSRPTIWSWENGRSRPRASHLAALAQALGVSEREVLGEDPTKEGGFAFHELESLPEALPQLHGSDSLIEAINLAKDQIARSVGTKPEKVRIIIEI